MSGQKITFLGLGAMGYPMAGHLAKAGYDVTVFNRTFRTAEKWKSEYKGRIAKTVEEAVKDADVALACVGNDNDVREIFDKILASAKSGAILIDHTTTSAIIARELYQQAKDKGMSFLDAPVSGGQAGAENAVLTIMVGGDQETFDKVSSLLDVYAKACTRIGGTGQGQVLKMINQISFIGTLQGLSEALIFAKAEGIDGKTIVDVLQHGAAGSWQMINRSETMMANDFDFGFAIDWIRKDLAICFEEAEKLGVELPLAKQIDERYKALQERGYSRADTSVLIKQFDEETRDEQL
ncbi:MAG: NAD(P)-dependent oxidoreductase [Cocleimonas sp.]